MVTPNADYVGRYSVGDQVTVEYDDEGEPDTLDGTLTGFHNNWDGEQGFWFKYVVQIRGEDRTFISWWPLTAIVSVYKREKAPGSHRAGGLLS